MIPMNNVKYVLGSKDVLPSPLPVFDSEVCTFIAELSAEILKTPLSRAMPDLATLAFWGRKANIRKLKENFGDCEGRLGRGLCFHITPANIPMNFAFSYLFSLLAGNANIVRLPSKQFPQVDALCIILGSVIARYPEVKKRSAFVRYSRDNRITAAFSTQADARMLWGGDSTIAALKSIPSSPRCVDIAFADRYSVALLDGKAILETSTERMLQLAENFYNDTYLMDQNACSSPQIILWQNDDAAARKRFWDAVADYAEKQYALQDAVAVDKYTILCEEAVSNSNIKAAHRKGNLLYRVELEKLTQNISIHRGHGGFFYEYALKDWGELFAVVTEKFQTITYFGVSAEELRNAVVSARLRGIDRIVPVGRAMDIGVFWDGHDLIRELSRLIEVK